MSYNTRLIHKNCTYLKNSQKRLKDVFDVVFSCPEKPMTEDAAFVGKKRYRTYGQIKDEACKVAAGIYKLTGKTEQYIGLYADNKPAWFAMFWGILLSGNYPYLINLRQPLSFSEEVLDTLKADTVIYLGNKPMLQKNCLCYDDVVSAGCDGLLECLEFGDCFALSTSGTTLKKKICVYTGKEIVSQILNAEFLMKKTQKLIDGKRKNNPPKQLVFLPLYHIFGLEAVFLWYSMWHSVFVFPIDLAPDHLLHAIRDCRVTHIYAVPVFWETIVKSVNTKLSKDEKLKAKVEKVMKISVGLQKVCPCIGELFAKKVFAEIRKQLFGDNIVFCISGGSYIKKETLHFINALGYCFVNGYGMSELGITSVETSHKIKKRLDGSIGSPIETVEYVIDDNGHLLVKGDSVCKKMIIDGEEIINDDFFDTGDIMERDKNGRFFVLGRSSDIVFGADGENLNPDFAEQYFSLSVAKSYTVMGDENKERLIMIVEISDSISDEQKLLLKDEIDAGCKMLPASYKLKQVYYTTDSLMPKNSIKVSRAYVRNNIDSGSIKLFENIDEKILQCVEQTDESNLKKELRVLFADVLNKDASEISDAGHFMNDLGGSSLDYFSLLSKVDEIYGVTMDFEPENFNYSLNDFERILSERADR